MNPLVWSYIRYQPNSNILIYMYVQIALYSRHKYKSLRPVRHKCFSLHFTHNPIPFLHPFHQTPITSLLPWWILPMEVITGGSGLFTDTEWALFQCGYTLLPTHLVYPSEISGSSAMLCVCTYVGWIISKDQKLARGTNAALLSSFLISEAVARVLSIGKITTMKKRIDGTPRGRSEQCSMRVSLSGKPPLP